MSDNDQNRSDKQWSGKTGGTKWMQQSLIGMFRHINPVLVYPIICIWILFYIAFGHAGRRGIWHYWCLRTPANMPSLKRWCWRVKNLYLNYLEFGKVIMDRFAAYSGRKIHVTIKGEEILNKLNNEPGGFIVLSTHLGNQELAGYTFHMTKPMYVLVHVGDTETVNENRQQAFEKMGLHVIPVRIDGSHVISMHNALSEGNILSIHADRLFFDTKATTAIILGEEAKYPEGPFRIAIAERVPVVTLFMMRERASVYTLHVRLLSDGIYSEKRRDEKMKTLLTKYVAANEEILQRYPHQWFHFYEFWK